MALSRIFACGVAVVGSLGQSYAADTSDRVTVPASRAPSGYGWSDGTLSVRFSDTAHRSEVVSIEFTAAQVGAIQSLTVRTGHWKADPSRYAMSLPIAYPNRMEIAVEDWTDSGEIKRLAIAVPYLAGEKPNPGDQRSACRTREIFVENGKVTETEDHDDSRSLCWY